MLIMCACLTDYIQMLLVVLQSVVLGYLTDYFSIQDPTAEETRNAYLYALGACDNN